MPMRMIRLWNDIRDFLFPRECLVCGKILLPSERSVCVCCLASLPHTGFHYTPADNLVARSFWGKFPVEKATSCFYYHKGGDVSRVLHALKYRGRKEVGQVLGRYAARLLQPAGFFEDIDVLLPVPLHPAREKVRGYNQSLQIAQGIASVTGLPIDTSSLHRTHNNLTQTHNSRFERWQNAQGLFRVTDAAPLQGKHVLLIDDVLTTGATLVACADALNGIPGLHISVLTLAVAQ